MYTDSYTLCRTKWDRNNGFQILVTVLSSLDQIETINRTHDVEKLLFFPFHYSIYIFIMGSNCLVYENTIGYSLKKHGPDRVVCAHFETFLYEQK